MTNHKPQSEVYREAADAWVDADAAARLLEETKSSVLSQRMLALNEKSVSKAELMVKASDYWEEYVRKTCNARTHANKLKVAVEVARMRAWERQSLEANERVELRMVR